MQAATFLPTEFWGLVGWFVGSLASGSGKNSGA